jgi:hypothetical protein
MAAPAPGPEQAEAGVAKTPRVLAIARCTNTQDPQLAFTTAIIRPSKNSHAIARTAGTPWGRIRAMPMECAA